MTEASEIQRNLEYVQAQNMLNCGFGIELCQNYPAGCM
jgi:hypothetical protein